MTVNHNPRNLKSILIEGIDKPENADFARIINKFMDDNSHNTARKALYDLPVKYEFAQAQRDAWQEKYANLSRESRDTIRMQNDEIQKLKDQLSIVKDFFKLSKELK